MLGEPGTAIPRALDAAFVKASARRAAVLVTLRDWPKTAGQVAMATGLGVAHASRAIGELMDRGLAECRTPELSRGRIFSLTEAGEALADALHWDVARHRRIVGRGV